MQTPAALHHYPAATIAPVVGAYSHALHVVFLAAVPVALGGFVLALFLPQAPLRDTSQAAAGDLGDAFGMPVGDDRVAQLERSISALLRGSGRAAALEIAAAAGTTIGVADAWALATVASRVRQGQPTSIAAIAKHHHLPGPVLRPAFDTTRAHGYLNGGDDALNVTAAGRREVEQFVDAARDWLRLRLQDWDEQQNPALDEALRRIARCFVLDGESAVGPVPSAPATS